MYSCAQCAVEACRTGQLDRMPKNCPMRDPEFFRQVMDEYFKPETHEFYLTSTAIEFLGYCRWPRLREVAEFARRMGYTRLGLGFCVGLHKEAAVVDRVLRRWGFEVVSVACKTGAIPKVKAGVTQQNVFPQGTEGLRGRAAPIVIYRRGAFFDKQFSL